MAGDKRRSLCSQPAFAKRDRHKSGSEGGGDFFGTEIAFRPDQDKRRLIRNINVFYQLLIIVGAMCNHFNTIDFLCNEFIKFNYFVYYRQKGFL